jgi:hypothetical protein
MYRCQVRYITDRYLNVNSDVGSVTVAYNKRAYYPIALLFALVLIRALLRELSLNCMCSRKLTKTRRAFDCAPCCTAM